MTDSLIAQADSRLRALWRAAQEELRTNPRAVLGVCALGLILAVSLSLSILDRAERRQARASQLALEAVSLDGLRALDTAVLEELTASFGRRIETLEQSYWPGASQSVAQADFQQWVARTLDESGLGMMRTQPVEAIPVPGLDGVVELRVAASASTASQQLGQAPVRAALERIVRDPRLIRAPEMQLSFTGLPRFELVVATYYVPASERLDP